MQYKVKAEYVGQTHPMVGLLTDGIYDSVPKVLVGKIFEPVKIERVKISAEIEPRGDE
jgi:hypothetical protein